MSRLKISFIVTAIIVIVIGLIFTLSFNNSFPTTGATVAFVASKVIVTLLFVAGVCYALYSKANTGASATVVGFGILYQFIPLGIRFLVKSSFNHSVAVAWAIILVALALYIVLILGLSFQDKIMVEGDSKAAANEIAVEPEKRLATDDVNKD